MDTAHIHVNAMESNECDETLEHIGITATRRTWAAPCNSGRKNNMLYYCETNNNNNNNNNNTDGCDGLTVTNSTTLHNSTQITLDSLSTEYIQRQELRRQRRDGSTDVVWGYEDEEENDTDIIMNVTPSPALTRAQRPSWRNEMSFSIISKNILTEERTGDKYYNNYHYSNENYNDKEPPTESREISLRPGCTLPSPCTPLWTALEEEINEDNNNYNDNVAFVRGVNVNVEIERAIDVNIDENTTHVVTRRRWSNVRGDTISAFSFTSSSPPPPREHQLQEENIMEEEERRQVATTTGGRRMLTEEGGRGLVDINTFADESTLLQAMSERNQRRNELTLRQRNADLWAEQTRRFFELIDQRPLLTVTIDD